MLERNVLKEYGFSSEMIEMLKQNFPKLNTHVLTNPQDDYFLFEKPVTLDYVVESQVIQYSFLKHLVNEYYKDNDNVNINRHIVVLSPHETFNFKQKFNMKDYQLPLFIFKIQNTPLLNTFHNQFLISWEDNYFMQNTKQETKEFIINQYKQMREENDPEYVRETFKDKVIPTLYYDQQVQNIEQSLNIYQETNRELNKFFIMMNTRLFQQTPRKFEYLLPIDRLIRETNKQQNEIVDKFQFPIFFLLSYYVSWESYTNSTNYGVTQNDWNLQIQQYNFKIDTQVLTRFNLQVSLLKMSIDMGIEVGEGEDPEWIKRINIK